MATIRELQKKKNKITVNDNQKPRNLKINISLF